MSINRKIRGAEKVQIDGINFRSKFEAAIYKKLKESGLKFEYEPEKVILWEGFKPKNILIYKPQKIKAGKFGPDLLLKIKSMISITYTIDFIIYLQDTNTQVHLEVKGMENDTYPLKLKMYLKYLDNLDDGVNHIFVEIRKVEHFEKLIEIIKKL